MVISSWESTISEVKTHGSQRELHEQVVHWPINACFLQESSPRRHQQLLLQKLGVLGTPQFIRRFRFFPMFNYTVKGCVPPLQNATAFHLSFSIHQHTIIHHLSFTSFRTVVIIKALSTMINHYASQYTFFTIPLLTTINHAYSYSP